MTKEATSLLVVELSADDKRKLRRLAVDNDTSLRNMVKNWIDTLPPRAAMTSNS
jgi:hypothetical protein